MPTILRKSLYLPFVAAITLLGQSSCTTTGEVSAVDIDPEDQAIIDEASCSELQEEYRDFPAAEKEVANEIEQRGQVTVGTNLVGAASFATLGFGIFSWDTAADAQENLAELRQIRLAIERTAQRKGCSLPQ